MPILRDSSLKNDQGPDSCLSQICLYPFILAEIEAPSYLASRNVSWLLCLRNVSPKDAFLNRILSASVHTLEMSFLRLRSQKILHSVASPSRQHFLRIGNSTSKAFWRYSLSRRYASNFSGPSLPGQIGPLNNEENENTKESQESPSPQKVRQAYKWNQTLFKMFESAATTFVSIMVLGYDNGEPANSCGVADVMTAQDGWIWLPSILQILGFEENGTRL